MRKDELIRKALNKTGYDCDPTENNLIDVFLEFVDQGAFNITLEEAEDMVKCGEISIEDICRNLMKRVG